MEEIFDANRAHEIDLKQIFDCKQVNEHIKSFYGKQMFSCFAPISVF